MLAIESFQEPTAGKGGVINNGSPHEERMRAGVQMQDL